MSVTKKLNTDWSCIYARAVQEDGELFFPERLTHDFLKKTRKAMGSYIFANQYQNEIIPLDDQTFKEHWRKYYVQLPPLHYTYAFIDPAISEEDTADYTAVVVVSVDAEQNWYVRAARRERLNPSEIIQLCFDLKKQYQPYTIGIESVAFQRALIHFAGEEMRRRGDLLPIADVKRSSDKTKHMRIMSLVPRFEWGTLFLKEGMFDLELEMGQFPRGAHDDILDALASIADIASYPVEKGPTRERNPATNSPHYEQWYIQNVLAKRAGTQQPEPDE